MAELYVVNAGLFCLSSALGLINRNWLHSLAALGATLGWLAAAIEAGLW